MALIAVAAVVLLALLLAGALDRHLEGWLHAVTTCAVCSVECDPHFVGLSDEPVCLLHCVDCTPCPTCDGLGFQPCPCPTVGDCTCPLWTCGDCGGAGYDTRPPVPLGGEPDAGDGAQHDRRPRQALGSASPARGAVDGPEGSADSVRATHVANRNATAPGADRPVA